MKQLNLVLSLGALTATLAQAGGGGLGNGTDLYRCDKSGGETYEVLDVYEGRLRGQALDLKAATAEGVLSEMTQRLAEIDPYNALLILDEGTRFLKGLRALQKNEELAGNSVLASTGKLIPGLDSHRLTHPDNCVPMRLVDQNPNPELSTGRYKVDLELLKNIDEQVLGVSAFHEGLYRIVLGFGINSSVGVRSITALTYSNQIKALSFQAYLQELSAAGIPYYVIQGRKISTQYQLEVLKNSLKGKLAEPENVFGLVFTEVEFSRPEEEITLYSQEHKALRLKQPVLGERPSFVPASNFRLVRVDWRIKNDRQSTFTEHFKIRNPKNREWIDHSYSMTLDSNMNIIKGGIAKTPAKQTLLIDRKWVGKYFSCWRNRLLRQGVTVSEVDAYNASLSRVTSTGEYELQKVKDELRECRSSEFSRHRGRYSDESFVALKRAVDSSSKNSDSIGFLKSLLEQEETCSIHWHAFQASFIVGGAVGVSKIRCENYAGYSNTYLGLVAGFDLVFGLGVESNQAKVEHQVAKHPRAMAKAFLVDEGYALSGVQSNSEIYFRHLSGTQNSDKNKTAGLGLPVPFIGKRDELNGVVNTSAVSRMVLPTLKVAGRRREQFWINRYLESINRTSKTAIYE